MKRFIAAVVGLVFAASGMSEATGFDVNKSSYVTGNLTTQQITGTDRGNTLSAVIISTVSATGGQITLYDSQGTNTNAIATIELDSLGFYPFEVRLSSGLSYTTVTNSGVTITYR